MLSVVCRECIVPKWLMLIRLAVTELEFVCVLWQNDWHVVRRLTRVYCNKMAEADTSCSHWTRLIVCVLWQNDCHIVRRLPRVYCNTMAEVNTSCSHRTWLIVCVLWQNDWHVVRRLPRVCCNKTAEVGFIPFYIHFAVKLNRMCVVTKWLICCRSSAASILWQNGWS